ncbi:MAG: hypothetical protein HYW47_00715 [Deltaproteobacteria bacterium]|nr:hypothetical protein [Deltaproteobacteria bacterium]
MSSIPKITAEIVQKKNLTPELWILWLKPSQKFEWQPGQYCTLGFEGTERPYSICSAPSEGIVELFLEVVPENLKTERSLTPKLLELDVGTHIEMRAHAKGRFLVDKTCTTRVMVATVTGIAPFISMIRAHMEGYYGECKKPFYIFQGVSYMDEFGYEEELKRYHAKGKVYYVPTVSRPQEPRNKAWRGEIGRVNEILDRYFKKLAIQPI